MKARCLMANGLWIASQAPRWQAFRRALGDPERAQRERLRAILAANGASEFGRRHDFAAIDGPRAFRERVPSCTHEDLAPAIERIARGEPAVLTGERVEALAWTSGSTGGAKLLPTTPSLLREFQRAIGPWVFELHRRRPALLGGPSYWSVSPLPPRAAPVGPVPVGFEEDGEYLGGLAKRLVEVALAVPGSIRGEADGARFRFLTALFLVRAPELRLISVWHPSFLALLLDELETSWEALVRAVAEGLDDPRWPRLGRGDRARARVLERCGPDARALWPRLGLVSTWTDGHAGLGAAELRRRLPGVAFEAKGLVATEAFVSLPFGDQRPLAVRSHFLEFERDDGRPCLAHELEVGDEAGVIVTTSGGLYRYRLGDRVRVEGFLGRTPCVAFVGRVDGRSDLCGEKLSEAFVADRIARFEAAAGLRLRFARLVPGADERGTPVYCLELEVAADVALVPALAGAFEALLCENPHYDHCVRVGQLAPCRIRRVENGHARYAEACLRRGQRLGDVKPPALASTLDSAPAPSPTVRS